MKLHLLKQTAMMAIISCSLGLAGCAGQTADSEITPLPECVDETGVECVMVTSSQTEMYLPQFSSQSSYQALKMTEANGTVLGKTGEKTPVDVVMAPGGKNGTDLSFSRPAGEKAVSVKDKKKTVSRSNETVMTVETKTQSVKQPVQVPNQVETISTTKTITTSEPVVTVTKTQNVQKSKDVQQTTVTTQASSMADKVAYGEKCHDWEAKSGDTLRNLLMKWGEESGWTVIWKLDRDYHLEAGVVFRGTFTEVSGALIRSFARATPAPIGTFYKGNRVLVINTQEDENAD